MVVEATMAQSLVMAVSYANERVYLPNHRLSAGLLEEGSAHPGWKWPQDLIEFTEVCIGEGLVQAIPGSVPSGARIVPPQEAMVVM
jgi:hypothetical protein